MTISVEVSVPGALYEGLDSRIGDDGERTEVLYLLPSVLPLGKVMFDLL